MNMKTIRRHLLMALLIVLLAISLIANYYQFVNRLNDQTMIAKMITGNILSLARAKSGKLSLLNEEVKRELREGVNYLVSKNSMDRTSYTVIGNVRADREFNNYGFSADKKHEIENYLDRNK